MELSKKSRRASPQLLPPFFIGKRSVGLAWHRPLTSETLGVPMGNPHGKHLGFSMEKPWVLPHGKSPEIEMTKQEKSKSMVVIFDPSQKMVIFCWWSILGLGCFMGTQSDIQIWRVQLSLLLWLEYQTSIGWERGASLTMVIVYGCRSGSALPSIHESSKGHTYNCSFACFQTNAYPGMYDI